MINEIIEKLNKAKLSAWQIQEAKKTSYQSFMAKEELECTRTVETTLYTLTIHKKKDDGTLGIANFRLGPNDLGLFDKKLEEALFTASLVSNQQFELPDHPASLPEVHIADADAGEASLKQCQDRFLSALQKEKNVRPSTTEFFIDRLSLRLVNNKGLDVSQDETKYHTEIILLATSGKKENEFINRYSRRFANDFDLEGEVALSAKYAREATVATLPKTGHYPVLISEEPLDNLFNPVVAQASARLKYNKMTTSELGKSITPSGDPKGDSITLWSNGHLKGLLGSNRFDSYGSPTNKTCLIENNKVKTFLADKRYSDYLSVPLTGEMGNVEVAGGTRSFSDIQKEAVYQLTAFSAFEPNSITGAFSAEIRSGYKITPNGVEPIKGGSVSGLLQKDLLDCFLSKEQTHRERALVPKGILFKNLAIAGN